jgi:hypothetical protein
MLDDVVILEQLELRDHRVIAEQTEIRAPDFIFGRKLIDVR